MSISLIKVLYDLESHFEALGIYNLNGLSAAMDEDFCFVTYYKNDDNDFELYVDGYKNRIGIINLINESSTHALLIGSLHDKSVYKELTDFIDSQYTPPTNWKNYKRKGEVKCRPVTPGDIKTYDRQNPTISVSREDFENGSPRIGDMLATDDLSTWLICEEFFKKNYEA